jgi:hypothetical protein
MVSGLAKSRIMVSGLARIMVSGLAKLYFLMLRKILSLSHLLTIKQDSLKLPILP